MEDKCQSFSEPPLLKVLVEVHQKSHPLRKPSLTR
jgi:hypothetical protein